MNRKSQGHHGKLELCSLSRLVDVLDVQFHWLCAAPEEPLKRNGALMKQERPVRPSEQEMSKRYCGCIIKAACDRYREDTHSYNSPHMEVRGSGLEQDACLLRQR